MCQFKLDFIEVERKFALNFYKYFSLELEKIRELESFGLVAVLKSGFNVSEKGRFLIRNIAVVFDKHYRQGQNKYSKVI